MRTSAFGFFVLATLALALPACDDDTLRPPSQSAVPAELGVPVKLGIGQAATYDGDVLRVAFGDLLEDSRCPDPLVCIDAGQVRVRMVAVHTESPPVVFELETSSLPLTFYDYAGFRIELLDLEPYPTEGNPTQRSDYRLKIVVTAL